MNTFNMENGELFKTIRLSRNISQKEICKKQLSRTTLSKFENGKCLISYSNYIYLINSLDISLDEYDFIISDYTLNKKQEIISAFEHIFSTYDDKVYLENLIKKTENYLNEFYSKTIWLIYKILLSFSTLENDNNKIPCISKLYISDIWKEIAEFEDWTLLDIKIINCSLYFFEYETSITISNLLLKKLLKYKHFTDILPLQTSIYLNLVLLSLMNNDIDNAKKYSSLSLESSRKSKRIDYLIISFVRFGICFNDEKSIQHGLELFNYIDNSNLKKSLEKEIKDFMLISDVH